MNTTRTNPFSDIETLPAFEPKPKAPRPIANDQVDKIAEASGFQAAKPRGRRRPPEVVAAIRPGAISKSTSRPHPKSSSVCIKSPMPDEYRLASCSSKRWTHWKMESRADRNRLS